MIQDKPRILLVEDEEAIAQGLLVNFRRKGWRPTLAGDGERALSLAGEERFDLMVLDVMLPTISGFDVCQRLRAANDLTPILMLTAKNQPDDIVYGLKLGADDYVTKPFDLAELLARVEGLLRRSGWSKGTAGDDRPSPAGERFVFGDFWVDFASWRALTLNGETELSRKEIAVMRVFANRPGQVVSRRELLAEVWGLPDHPNTRVVDNVILSLRKGFEESSLRPRHIHNVRGVGYRFEI
jgi:DNA-binding response OmpR family regulator